VAWTGTPKIYARRPPLTVSESLALRVSVSLTHSPATNQST